MIKTPSTTMIGSAGIWTPSCTVIGSMQKTLDQLIKSLFANNERGFTRTPDDLTTMFQDAVGTIPVTAAGQPLGLVLDKSKAMTLGDELVINGSFNQPPTGWSSSTTFLSSATVSDGELVVTAQQENGRQVYKINCVVGKSYVVTGSCRLVSGTGSSIITISSDSIGGGIHAVTANSSSVPIKTRSQFTATTTTYYVSVGSTSGIGVTAFDNISVRELAGNHAYQATSSMRPLLVTSPQRLDYDTVDDKLITNLPAQLTGCTVVRAVPSVGTQILTNQTIPTPYNDSTDHCGLIVINRALTATETSQITKLFNKAAGV